MQDLHSLRNLWHLKLLNWNGCMLDWSSYSVSWYSASSCSELLIPNFNGSLIIYFFLNLGCGRCQDSRSISDYWNWQETWEIAPGCVSVALLIGTLHLEVSCLAEPWQKKSLWKSLSMYTYTCLHMSAAAS